MDFEASLRYLNSFLNLERITPEAAGRSWNLERMQLLLKWAGHPEKTFFPVLIAGTKGKGSTGFFLAAMLEAAGLPAGFYSSPHLETPLERIRLGTRMISREAWSRNTARIRTLLSRHRLPAGMGAFTYFELLTLLAVLVFAEARVRIGVFEVGMGGRLDATNALDAPLVLITPINLDHEAVLGNTIAKIAGEKAAIIRPRAEVVLAPQVPEAARVVFAQARRMKAHVQSPAAQLPATPGLAGEYQRVNAAAALRAVEILEKKFGFSIPQTARARGIRASHWPGRFESFSLPEKRRVILDGAHNPVSAMALVRHLRTSGIRPSVLVFGTSRDKRADRMLEVFGSIVQTIVLTRAANPRSCEPGALLPLARPHFHTLYPAGCIREALALALRLCPPGGTLVAAGSFYLIGELRPLLRRGHA